VDAETLGMLKTAGPHAFVLAATVIGWLELRALPLVRRVVADHRAVTRKVGVTDEDVAAELAKLKGGTAHA